jgi:hypothetical protein
MKISRKPTPPRRPTAPSRPSRLVTADPALADGKISGRARGRVTCAGPRDVRISVAYQVNKILGTGARARSAGSLAVGDHSGALGGTVCPTDAVGIDQFLVSFELLEPDGLRLVGAGLPHCHDRGEDLTAHR